MCFVSVDEYLMGRAKLEDLPPDLQANTSLIVPAANQLLALFGEYRPVTSGYRRPEDNAHVPNPKPHSRHLTCQAVDLADSDGRLDAFLTDEVLEKLGLWREHPDYTKGWAHVQIVPPASGRRTFIP